MDLNGLAIQPSSKVMELQAVSDRDLTVTHLLSTLACISVHLSMFVLFATVRYLYTLFRWSLSKFPFSRNGRISRLVNTTNYEAVWKRL